MITHADVLTMQAGYEMDELIQERIMGGHKAGHESDLGFFVMPPPEYSTEHSAARLVLEKARLSEDEQFVVNRSANGWLARFDCCKPKKQNWGRRTPGAYEAEAETMPLAVCRAALLAVVPVESSDQNTPPD